MAFSLSSLDVHHLVRELRPLVQDSFVDKVYQGKEERGDFLLRLRSPRTGKQQLYVKAPDACFLTEHRFSWPQQPPGFCMQLRKHLGNSQLVGVEQHGFERVIELSFRKGETRWTLVVELFSKGNVVLVNEEGLIRGVMDLQRWKDRTLRVNASYEYPPGARSTHELDAAGIASLFEAEGRDLVRFCATSLGLGGKYAEELVARSGLDKDQATLGAEDARKLHEALRSMLEEPPTPVIHDGDASPIPLRAWPEAEPAASFSAAVESLVVSEKTGALEDEAQAMVRKTSGKWERIIEEQTHRLEGYRRSAEENQRRGELIYERYQELSSLLSLLREAQARDGWKGVKALVKERSLPLSVDEHRGTVSLDVSE